jgi:DUF2950 family protein
MKDRAITSGPLTAVGIGGRLFMCVALAVSLCCKGAAPKESGQRTFQSPEDAAQALNDAAKASSIDGLIAIFGPDGRELIDTSDAVTARQNRDVFTVAFKESARWVDDGANSKTLVIGREGWPFPVPLVKDGNAWRFDTTAGKEEIIARRIGRNEIAVIRICRTYVTAQRVYAKYAHDGKPTGIYATAFRSSPGQQNGLYWPSRHGERRSPLGDLVAEAATEGRDLAKEQPPAPFHGYYFRILTSQGPAASGGPQDYIVNGLMSKGFALVAWPAKYDVTGVMTFVVNQDGTVREKDLGSGTEATAKAMTAYNPEGWDAVQ